MTETLIWVMYIITKCLLFLNNPLYSIFNHVCKMTWEVVFHQRKKWEMLWVRRRMFCPDSSFLHRILDQNQYTLNIPTRINHIRLFHFVVNSEDSHPIYVWTLKLPNSTWMLEISQNYDISGLQDWFCWRKWLFWSVDFMALYSMKALSLPMLCFPRASQISRNFLTLSWQPDL